MLDKRVRKYIINPYYGLTPFLLYLVLLGATKNIENSLIISSVFALIAEFSLRIYTKMPKMGMEFLLVLASLLLTFLFWIPFRKSDIGYPIYVVLPEVFIVIIMIILRIPKVAVNLRLFKKDSGPLQKAFVNEFFESLSFGQYFFTLHIFIVVIYKFLKDNYNYSNSSDGVVFLLIPIVGIVSLMLFENIKLSRIVKEMRKEEWLPIVNERGEVKGKIAKSISINMKNKFLHPVVRVVFICNGKIYLQSRESDDILDSDKLDHPFEKYMLFNHEINLAVRNSIVRILGKELPFRFLIKYTFENENTKRLVFLFMAKVEKESDIEKLPSLKGKFWSQKQIESDMLTTPGIFGECFQLEYEYLKNTVVAADQLVESSI